MKPINKFEEELYSCVFTPDWREERADKGAIFESHLFEASQFSVFESCNPTDIPQLKVVLARIYGQLYMWIDFIENDLCEGSQLERITNSYLSTILYTNQNNDIAWGCTIFRMIENNMLKRTI